MFFKHLFQYLSKWNAFTDLISVTLKPINGK